MTLHLFSDPNFYSFIFFVTLLPRARKSELYEWSWCLCITCTRIRNSVYQKNRLKYNLSMLEIRFQCVFDSSTGGKVPFRAYSVFFRIAS